MVAVVEPISNLNTDVLTEYRFMILSNHHAYFRLDSIIPGAHGYTRILAALKLL